jgi:hypothetical protein
MKPTMQSTMMNLIENAINAIKNPEQGNAEADHEYQMLMYNIALDRAYVAKDLFIINEYDYWILRNRIIETVVGL